MSIWLTSYEVLRLLTTTEAVAFGTSILPAVVLIRLDVGAISDMIDIASDDFVACVDAMQAAGILTQERAAQVKAGQKVRE